MKDDRPGSTPIGKKGAYRIISITSNVLFFVIGISTLFASFYDTYKQTTTYNSLGMSFLASRTLEYGSDEYDLRGFIENIDDGVIKDYTKEIDTNKVGVQQVKFEIGKGDVKKEFATSVEVIDTKKPIIEFKQNTVTIYKGSSYNYRNNIKRVHDVVDGDIKYSSEQKKEKVDYYFIVSNVNRNKVGTYKVTVNAYDVNGNSASKSFNVVVKNKPVVKRATTTTTTAKKTTTIKTYKTYTGKASVDTSSIVATAKSFVGYRYVRGGASPSKGFDCSGLVMYVYGLHGKKLGHGTLAQSKSGKAVARKDMQPGDIILWSTKKNNYPTHAAIYIGNDKMVHAANTRTGVIISNVSYWEKYGGGHIATIRRV